MKKAFSKRPLILIEMDGKEFSSSINADIVKKYCFMLNFVRDKYHLVLNVIRVNCHFHVKNRS